MRFNVAQTILKFIKNQVNFFGGVYTFFINFFWYFCPFFIIIIEKDTFFFGPFTSDFADAMSINRQTNAICGHQKN